MHTPFDRIVFGFSTARGFTAHYTEEDLDILLASIERSSHVKNMILAERAEILFVPVTPTQQRQLDEEHGVCPSCGDVEPMRKAGALCWNCDAG